jgi:hypothetical protein
MRVDCAYRDVKPLADFLIGVAEREEMKNVAFSLRERDEFRG